MDSIIEIALTLGYVSIFIWIISKLKFFRNLAVPVKWFQAVFVLKVISGVFLYLIYTRYYTDRSTADIFKYFDDSAVLFNAAYLHPVDFLKMMFGAANDNAYFNETYYQVMNHWNRPYGGTLGNDTHTIIRFNALARFISLGYYNVHSVFLNFLSLIGLTGIFIFLKRLLPKTPRILFVLVFLFPGVIFWGSGVLKEGLLFFGIGMLLYSVVRFLPINNESKTDTSWLWGGGVVLSIVFLTTVKSYALAAILPGILALRYANWKGKTGSRPVLVSYTVAVILALGLSMANSDFGVLEKLTLKQKDFITLAKGGTYIQTQTQPLDTLYVFAKYHENFLFSENHSTVFLNEEVQAVNWRNADSLNKSVMILPKNTTFNLLLDYGNAGSRIDIPVLEPTAWSFLKTAPMAFVNGLMRPFPWEARSPFMLLALIENLILMLLFGTMIFKFNRLNVNWQIWWLSFIFALFIILLTGWVTPIIGAIVRYKVPALPFIAAVMVALIDQGFLQKVERALLRFG